MISELDIPTSPVDLTTASIPLWVLMVLGFSIAYAITHFGIPIIVKAAVLKGLFAETNSRSTHKKPVPVLGGVGVFTGFILSTSVVAGSHFPFELSYFITGLLLIFIVGVKDDILGGTPHKKFIGQTLAALFICVLADIRINQLHGFIGIGHIPYSLSIILTVLVLLVLINGFNLIDGIDGLASGIGILVSFVLGIWFFITGNIACTIMCAALAGGLVSFFIYNVFSRKNKIFLGDTGSHVIGLVLGVLVVRFLQLEPSSKGFAEIDPAIAFSVSLFILPLFDTLRVFSIRIAQGKSPFEADRQHIHHRMLELGFSHLQSTLILLSVNLVFIITCYLLQDLGNVILISIQLIVASLLSYRLVTLVKEKNSKAKTVKRVRRIKSKVNFSG
jgi:UDP-N-acetylmuramyl pentapeptide phosphotransferase/UDP-N-acetylglucosamine-1-phosphate transferase